jgi:hypothetical protein
MFEPRLGHVGYVVDKMALGRFLLSTLVPLPIFIPPTPSYYSLTPQFTYALSTAYNKIWLIIFSFEG